MKKKNIVLWTALLTAAAVVFCAFPAFASPEDAGGETAGGEAAAEPATAPPTEAPPTAPPAAPTPVITSAPPTQAPATPVPTEAPGNVNVYFYVYTSEDAPAAGYTVQVGSSKTTTGADGLATFSGISVAQQAVTITAPDNTVCTGRLYMSRAASTRITDQAMGGTYGVDIARGQNELYFLTTFVPDGALLIRSATNSQPVLPQPAATAAPSEPADEAQVLALTATFLDSENKGISGMHLTAVTDAGQPLEAVTGTNGQIDLPQVPYGHYAVAAEIPGAPADSFDLTIQPGTVTGIAGNAGRNMIVTAAPAVKHLYLQFTRTAAGFVLSEASDSPITSGMNSVIVGIIAVAAIAAAGIIVIVVLRRKKKKKAAVPPSAGTPYTPQRKINYDPSTERLHTADEQPKRTGGANKFDDRSKL